MRCLTAQTPNEYQTGVLEAIDMTRKPGDSFVEARENVGMVTQTAPAGQRSPQTCRRSSSPPLHHLEWLLESCELTRASLESVGCTFVANLEHVCTTGAVSESLLYSSSEMPEYGARMMSGWQSFTASRSTPSVSSKRTDRSAPSFL